MIWGYPYFRKPPYGDDLDVQSRAPRFEATYLGGAVSVPGG